MGTKALIASGVIGLGVASLFAPVIPTERTVSYNKPIPGVYTLYTKGSGCEFGEYERGSRIENIKSTPFSRIIKRIRGYDEEPAANDTEMDVQSGMDWDLRKSSIGDYKKREVELKFSDGDSSRASSSNSSSFGIGYRISPNLVLTADHVVALADNSLARDENSAFSVGDGVSEVIILSEEKGYLVDGRPAVVAYRDKNKDLALLLVDQNASIQSREGAVKFRAYVQSGEEGIHIRVGKDETFPVLSVTPLSSEDRVVYSTNEILEPGMSGSIITDKEGRVLGVLQTAIPGTLYFNPELQGRVRKDVLTKHPELQKKVFWYINGGSVSPSTIVEFLSTYCSRPNSTEPSITQSSKTSSRAEQSLEQTLALFPELDTPVYRRTFLEQFNHV